MRLELRKVIHHQEGELVNRVEVHWKNLDEPGDTVWIHLFPIWAPTMLSVETGHGPADHPAMLRSILAHVISGDEKGNPRAGPRSRAEADAAWKGVVLTNALSTKHPFDEILGVVPFDPEFHAEAKAMRNHTLPAHINGDHDHGSAISSGIKLPIGRSISSLPPLPADVPRGG